MKSARGVALGCMLFSAAAWAAPRAQSYVSQSDRGKQLMTDILAAAYASNGPSSQKFAEDLFATCMKRGGNMDPVLGQRL